MAGILYGVGVGPGDPELITIKAKRTIEECEVVGIPHKDKEKCIAYGIARQIVDDIDTKEILPISISMTTDEELLNKNYDEAADKIAALLDDGKNIAFLNLGDPTIYGTYMQLHERLRNRNYRAIIVNGVPSFCAVAARLDMPLGVHDEEIRIVPAAYKNIENGKINFDDEVVYVIMKASKDTEKVKDALAAMTDEIAVKAVTDCGMPTERLAASIDEIDDKAGYFTTVIVKKNK